MKGYYTNKKKRMRHTYEIHAILSSIYCINETTVKDEDIKNSLNTPFIGFIKRVLRKWRILQGQRKIGRNARFKGSAYKWNLFW